MTLLRHPSDPAGDQAAFWLVALRDAPEDEALRARFQAWHDAAPGHAAAWAETAQVYDMIAALPAAAVRRRRSRLAPVAVLALAAGLALALLPGLWLLLRADERTATAQTRSVALPDGSVALLGADSALSVGYDDSERKVALLKGEAYFEVRADAARPFRVSAGEVTALVLGTAFDVHRHGDGGATVAVARGAVRVDSGASLTAGTWARLDAAGRQEQGRIPPGEVGSWRSGLIVARDRPMAEVFDDLRRHLPALVMLTNAAWAEQRVTGVYNTTDPVAALQAVAGAHGGTVTPVTPWLLVISPG